MKKNSKIRKCEENHTQIHVASRYFWHVLNSHILQLVQQWLHPAALCCQNPDSRCILFVLTKEGKTCSETAVFRFDLILPMTVWQFSFTRFYHEQRVILRCNNSIISTARHHPTIILVLCIIKLESNARWIQHAAEKKQHTSSNEYYCFYSAEMFTCVSTTPHVWMFGKLRYISWECDSFSHYNSWANAQEEKNWVSPRCNIFFLTTFLFVRCQNCYFMKSLSKLQNRHICRNKPDWNTPGCARSIWWWTSLIFPPRCGSVNFGKPLWAAHQLCWLTCWQHQSQNTFRTQLMETNSCEVGIKLITDLLSKDYSTTTSWAESPFHSVRTCCTYTSPCNKN